MDPAEPALSGHTPTGHTDGGGPLVSTQLHPSPTSPVARSLPRVRSPRSARRRASGSLKPQLMQPDSAAVARLAVLDDALHDLVDDGDLLLVRHLPLTNKNITI
jgi:hypothetical protein